MICSQIIQEIMFIRASPVRLVSETRLPDSPGGADSAVPVAAAAPAAVTGRRQRNRTPFPR